MIRVIDRNSTTNEVVQKIVSPYGKFISYQYGTPGHGMTVCSTLTEARLGIGKQQNGKALSLDSTLTMLSAG